MEWHSVIYRKNLAAVVQKRLKWVKCLLESHATIITY